MSGYILYTFAYIFNLDLLYDTLGSNLVHKDSKKEFPDKNTILSFNLIFKHHCVDTVTVVTCSYIENRLIWNYIDKVPGLVVEGDSATQGCVITCRLCTCFIEYTMPFSEFARRKVTK